jgi:hypothetical protein
MEDEFLRDLRLWLLHVDQALEIEEPEIPLPRTPLD